MLLIMKSKSKPRASVCSGGSKKKCSGLYLVYVHECKFLDYFVLVVRT